MKFKKTFTIILSVVLLISVLSIPIYGATAYSFSSNDYLLSNIINNNYYFNFGDVTYESIANGTDEYTAFYSVGMLPARYAYNYTVTGNSVSSTSNGLATAVIVQDGSIRTYITASDNQYYGYARSTENGLWLSSYGTGTNALNRRYRPFSTTFSIPDVCLDCNSNISFSTLNDYADMFVEFTIPTAYFTDEIFQYSYTCDILVVCNEQLASTSTRVVEYYEYDYVNSDVFNVIDYNGTNAHISILPDFTDIYDEIVLQYGDHVFEDAEYINITNISTTIDFVGSNNDYNFYMGTPMIYYCNTPSGGDHYNELHSFSEFNEYIVGASFGSRYNIYNHGYSEGYSVGYDVGSENAYDNAYDEGYNVGYNAGFSANLGDLDILQFLDNVADGIMNLSITPALTIGGIITVIVGLALLLTLFKLFRG